MHYFVFTARFVICVCIYVRIVKLLFHFRLWSSKIKIGLKIKIKVGIF